MLVRKEMLMLKIMNKKYLAITLFLSVSQISFSQEKDFGIWLGADVQHKLTKKIDVEFSGNIRTFNNSSRIDQEFIEAGLQYKLNRTFSLSGSYRLINNFENDSDYHFRHKLFADLKASVPIHNLDLSGRIRIQRTTRMYIEEADDELAQYTGRIKLKADYSIKSFPLDPYAFAETFIPLSESNSLEIIKTRLSAGVKLKVTNRISLDFGYIYQIDTKPEDINSNILSVNYSIKF
jgi:hypothetical protein